jgi:hypothetical protein
VAAVPIASQTRIKKKSKYPHLEYPTFSNFLPNQKIMAKEQAAGFQQALSQDLNHCPVSSTKNSLFKLLQRSFNLKHSSFPRCQTSADAV